MSIPPLVCNTPPPPDQCEDDKDEDFDLHYRLSQEDDEENISYDYGNFSSYTNYCQETSLNDKTEHTITTEAAIFSENAINKISDKMANKIESSLNDNATPKCEDVAVEDLNLKIEEENINSDHLVTHSLDNAVDSDTYGISCIVDHLDSDKIVVPSNNDDDESSDEKSLSESNVIPLDNVDIQEDNSENTTEVHEVDQIASKINTETHQISDTIQTIEEGAEVETTVITDNFDDFEDFKFTATTISKDEVIANFEDPWNNNDTGSFGDFKANFESDSDNIQSLGDGQEVNDKDNIVNNFETNSKDADSFDDFGDFDDFKSSVKQEPEDKSLTETQLPHHVTVLNFQCPDNEAQIIDSINNILLNIFTEAIPDCEPESERTLDSMLTETWHHLKQVDERQPYMVHWNNSLGQKSLLKALCIDSRNILFGPKWNYLTPKYATSLSTAPLQPKHVAVPNTCVSEVDVGKKVTNKDNTSWTDPFSSDGQEDLEHLMATLDQMAHKHSTLKISELLSIATTSDKEKSTKQARPTNLDVFENAISVTNIDKIHSSTLSVQPLRHINLPDTHIFTPTDSETPRSKTIHYDNGPPVLLLPQQMTEGHKINIEPVSHTDKESNDDYWEFQDFKGVSGHTAKPNSDNLKSDEKIEVLPCVSDSTKPNVTYQTQLLQPMKVEPVVPTLNWPDPGEVKETFEDFSDFVSNSNWSSEPMATKDVLPVEKYEKVDENNAEDEFETFQSAPNVVSNHINHIQHNVNSLPKSESVTGIQKQMEALRFKSNEIVSPNQNSMKNNTVSKDDSDSFSTRQSPVSHTNILQPMNSLRAQQGGQILQPLSLESYSQINWPKPGIDLQNLSTFNPLESLQSLKSDTGSSGPSKIASPLHNKGSAQNDISDDDIWGDFVSSKPKQNAPKKTSTFPDDDEWTDFVSSPSLSQNSLNTISFNVQTNSNIQKVSNLKTVSRGNQNISLDIPTLNYITPKSTHRGSFVDKHFQNL